MSLEVYGNWGAPTFWRVATVLAFHNVVDFTFHEMSFGENLKKPEYLKIQPVRIEDLVSLRLRHFRLPQTSFAKFGQLPAIKHGDFTLFESRPIARYLDDLFSGRSGKRLIPQDIQLRALAEQWLSVDHDHLHHTLRNVVAEKQHWFGPVENAEKIKLNFDKANAIFTIFESFLAEKKTTFLAGDNFSIVEVSMLPFLSLYHDLGGEFAQQIDSRPHVKQWFSAASTHPAWVSTKSRAQ